MLRRTRLSLAAGLALAAAMAAAAPAPAAAEAAGAKVRLAVLLEDGSRILGVPSMTSIPVQTAYAKVEVPLAEIQCITVAQDREFASIQMRNGDKLTTVWNPGRIELETLLGKVSVPPASIERIDVTFFGAGAVPEGLKKHLVVYFPFDAHDAAQATDASGHNHHGELRGTMWTPAGRLGGARQFDGKSDYVYRPYEEGGPLYPKDGPFSVAAWFKTSAGGPVQQVVLSTHYAGTGNDGYCLAVDSGYSGGRALWGPCINPGNLAASRAPVDDGLWHHAVGVWDGRTSYFYIDGVLQDCRKAPGPLPYAHRASFRIGHQENNNAPHARDEFYYFRGLIDEVMVFDRALSAEEVGGLYGVPFAKSGG